MAVKLAGETMPAAQAPGRSVARNLGSDNLFLSELGVFLAVVAADFNERFLRILAEVRCLTPELSGGNLPRISHLPSPRYERPY